MKFFTVLLLASTIATGCGHANSESNRSVEGNADRSKPVCGETDYACKQLNIVARTRSQYGVGCWGHVLGGRTPNPSPPPQSYLASDTGKPGAPQLTPYERSVVDAIQGRLHSSTLRVVWLAYRFVVFDAVNGPCMDAAPGYRVLNVRCPAIAYYQPGEDPYGTSSGPPEMQC
jgi:hypothetical protein